MSPPFIPSYPCIWSWRTVWLCQTRYSLTGSSYSKRKSTCVIYIISRVLLTFDPPSYDRLSVWFSCDPCYIHLHETTTLDESVCASGHIRESYKPPRCRTSFFSLPAHLLVLLTRRRLREFPPEQMTVVLQKRRCTLSSNEHLCLCRHCLRDPSRRWVGCVPEILPLASWGSLLQRFPRFPLQHVLCYPQLVLCNI